MYPLLPVRRPAIALALAAFGAASSAVSLPLDQIQLPPGFTIAIYAEGLPGARSIARGAEGTLFIGSRKAGNVYAVVDTDGDQVADKAGTIDSGLNEPNGVAFKDGDLYVAEIHRILRYDDIENRLSNPPEPVVITDDLPTEQHHGWKYLDFGPDGKLYFNIGAPCNICDAAKEQDKRFATIMRVDPDGANQEIHAHGVRNSVGFTWHPETGEMYFTDNGRDHFGDDRPDDELNRAPEPGLHFGYPYFHDYSIPDPEFGAGHDPENYVEPIQALGPHVAALGLKFYSGDQFPAEYKNRLFIAQHGSWNRSIKIGYRVMMATLDDEGNVASYDEFATGWLQRQQDWGRPVDVYVMPDGALLVSDDKAGVIYRIAYTG